MFLLCFCVHVWVCCVCMCVYYLSFASGANSTQWNMAGMAWGDFSVLISTSLKVILSDTCSWRNLNKRGRTLLNQYCGVIIVKPCTYTYKLIWPFLSTIIYCFICFSLSLMLVKETVFLHLCTENLWNARSRKYSCPERALRGGKE